MFMDVVCVHQHLWKYESIVPQKVSLNRVLDRFIGKGVLVGVPGPIEVALIARLLPSMDLTSGQLQADTLMHLTWRWILCRYKVGHGTDIIVSVGVVIGVVAYSLYRIKTHRQMSNFLTWYTERENFVIEYIFVRQFYVRNIVHTTSSS